MLERIIFAIVGILSVFALDYGLKRFNHLSTGWVGERLPCSFQLLVSASSVSGRKNGFFGLF